MDETEFRRLLILGLGRAILFARENDVGVFRELILDACIHCHAIDPQIEGTRADFMFDLVNELPGRNHFRQAVLNSLSKCDDDWHAKQRFRFAARLAKSGDEQAKRLMYESFHPGPNMGEAIAIEFMNLDGIAGFLFAVEKIGKLLSGEPKNVDFGWLMSSATEYLGEQNTFDCLREEAKQNPLVQVYLKAVETSDTKSNQPSFSSWLKGASYEQLKTKLPIKWPVGLGFWGKRASEEDILRAAQGLVAATELEMQRSHLAIFRQRSFPLDLSILVQFAGSPNEQVQWAALSALTQISDPAVRALAIDLVRTKARWRELAINLLRPNYQPGDHEIILDWFEAEEDMETLHTFSRGLLAFWSANPSEELHNRMLLSLYEKCPCSYCREDAVSVLLERNALPEHIRAECAWDANEDIRDLIRADELKSVSPE